MSNSIKHIWFDSSDTLVTSNKTIIEKLQYQAFAEVTHRTVTPEVKAEFDDLFNRNAQSRGAVFHAVGAPQGFWAAQVATLKPHEVYTLLDPVIPEILKIIKTHVPVSLFSNVKADDILAALGVEKNIFTHVITGDMITEPKPALEGFYKMIELSKVLPEEIVYIGDNIEKDILPAKKVGLKTGLMWLSSSEADYSFQHFSDILNVFRI